MRSLKFILLSLFILFLSIVVIQNRELFMDEKVLKLNLFVWRDETPPIFLAMYFLAFFLMGLLLSYLHGLSGRFKARGVIKNHLETIRKLEEEIEILKSLPVHKENTPSEETQNV